jgi:hypothetical protein
MKPPAPVPRAQISASASEPVLPVPIQMKKSEKSEKIESKVIPKKKPSIIREVSSGVRGLAVGGRKGSLDSLKAEEKSQVHIHIHTEVQTFT